MTNIMVWPRHQLLLGFVVFHLLVIAASNYLVQIPVTFGSVLTTWGAFTFPFIFLATDLTVRLYGSSLARRIIFTALLPALLVSYVFSVVFYQGEFQGLMVLGELNSFVARIAFASLLAYGLGQLLDIKVFSVLRQRVAYWWVAPAVSTVVGSLLDTLVFFSAAFYQSSDAFMATHWPEIALVDYAVKLGVSLAVFVPAYGLLIKVLAKWLVGERQWTAA